MSSLRRLITHHPLEILWLLGIVFLACCAPYITSYDPYCVEMGERLQGVSREHLLGTDEYGRDLLTRIIYGSRTVVYVILLSAALSLFGGTTIGLVAGYWGGRIDLLLSRFVDAVQAFPDILIGLMLAAAFGPSLFTAILSVGSFGIPILARVVRGSVLETKETEYVQACRAIGASDSYILFKSILPNVLSPIIIQTSAIAPRAIITVAGLSFLGFGAQPPLASWGTMISSARRYMYEHPIYLLALVSILSVTIICVNLLGDSIRDILSRE